MKNRFFVRVDSEYEGSYFRKYMILDKDTNKVAYDMSYDWIKEIYVEGNINEFNWMGKHRYIIEPSKEMGIEEFLLLN